MCVTLGVIQIPLNLFSFSYCRWAQKAHRAVPNEALYGDLRIRSLISCTYLLDRALKLISLSPLNVSSLCSGSPSADKRSSIDFSPSRVRDFGKVKTLRFIPFTFNLAS